MINIWCRNKSGAFRAAPNYLFIDYLFTPMDSPVLWLTGLKSSVCSREELSFLNFWWTRYKKTNFVHPDFLLLKLTQQILEEAWWNTFGPDGPPYVVLLPWCYFLRRTKWKRQSAVSVEMLAEAGRMFLPAHFLYPPAPPTLELYLYRNHTPLPQHHHPVPALLPHPRWQDTGTTSFPPLFVWSLKKKVCPCEGS